MIVSLLKTFLDQSGGVRENRDIEYIHKMRVSSRRLREALPIFGECFPKKRHCGWLQAIKRVTQVLGGARDADVQIEFLKKHIDGAKGKKGAVGLSLLLLNLKQRRAKMQKDVLSELERLSASGDVEGLRKECETIIKGKPERGTKNDPLYLYEQAYCGIAERVSDLVGLDSCVEREGDIQGHHEMRIRAKKLRYAMETFSAIYPGRLQEEISSIKGLQDLLGEMHDHDVWIEMLRRLVKEPSSLAGASQKSVEVARDLSTFLADMEAVRHDRYLRFRNLWNGTVKEKTLPSIEEDINYSHRKVEWFESIVQRKDPVLAVISDIHGNAQALRSVMEDSAKRGVNAFLNAGDSVGYGPYPNEVVDWIRRSNFLSIIGNYDVKAVTGVGGGRKEKGVALSYARQELSKTRKGFLCSLPQEIMLNMGGKRVHMTHNIPCPADEPLENKREEEMGKAVGKLGADVVILGHTHRGFIKKFRGVTVINPGSVGLPYDGDSRASYAILRFNPISAELVRVEYDLEGASEALRKRRLPEEFAQMLLRGISLDAYKEAEGRLVRDRRTRDLAVEARAVATTYNPDISHPERVRSVALTLFDQLSPLHKMGADERCYLELASILHDIGFSKGRRGHHKTSLRLILNDQRLSLTAKERRIIGSIARYHRKALPEKGHYNLSNMSAMEQNAVIRLAALMRLADALDYSHGSIVKEIKVTDQNRKVVLECNSEEAGRLERVAFEKKKDLFEKAFKKEIGLLWHR